MQIYICTKFHEISWTVWKNFLLRPQTAAGYWVLNIFRTDELIIADLHYNVEISA